MDEMEIKTRLGFRENFANFLEKIYGGAEEGEESCFNFWVSESCFKFQISELLQSSDATKTVKSGEKGVTTFTT